MLIHDVVAEIKRQKTPTSRFIYRLGKSLMRAEIPAPKPVFGPMLTAHQLGTATYQQLVQRLYYQPMFRARCESCGPGLILGYGLPYIHGPVRIRVGKECHIEGRTGFTSGSRLDAPTLTIGDHSYIGHGVSVSVSKSVSIGSYVKIAGGCQIYDNPGHPMDAIKRRDQRVEAQSIRPVVIEDDVWLGTGVVVMPGVHIGRGTVVGVGSVVTKDLPAHSLAVGNPARVVRALDTQEQREQALASIGPSMGSLPKVQDERVSRMSSNRK